MDVSNMFKSYFDNKLVILYRTIHKSNSNAIVYSLLWRREIDEKVSGNKFVNIISECYLC